MTKTAYMYESEGEPFFKEEVPCQRDPVESKLQGEDVWLLPANCTFEKPPEAEEGFVILFKQNKWKKLRNLKGKSYWLAGEGYYDAPHTMTEYGDLPEGASLERPEMTADEKAKADAETEISTLEAQLAETDYVAAKIAEGVATKEDYAEVLAQRQAWRTRINELQELLA